MGKIKQIMHCDWLPKWARWNDTVHSEFPFCSCNNIPPKSKWVHESFLLQNIFPDSEKIFCAFSVGIELENKKTETCLHFSGLETNGSQLATA